MSPAAHIVANLDEKLGDPVFTRDVPFLLEPSIQFDHNEAVAAVRERLVALL